MGRDHNNTSSSGDFLPLSGGTISGNLTVGGTLNAGSEQFTSAVISGSASVGSTLTVGSLISANGGIAAGTNSIGCGTLTATNANVGGAAVLTTASTLVASKLDSSTVPTLNATNANVGGAAVLTTASTLVASKLDSSTVPALNATALTVGGNSVLTSASTLIASKLDSSTVPVLNAAQATVTGTTQTKALTVFDSTMTNGQTDFILFGRANALNASGAIGFLNNTTTPALSAIVMQLNGGSAGLTLNGNNLLTVGGGITSTGAANTFGASTIGTITNTAGGNTLGSSTFNGLVTCSNGLTSTAAANTFGASTFSGQINVNSGSNVVSLNSTTNFMGLQLNSNNQLLIEGSALGTLQLQSTFNTFTGNGTLQFNPAGGSVITKNSTLDDGSGNMQVATKFLFPSAGGGLLDINCTNGSFDLTSGGAMNVRNNAGNHVNLQVMDNGTVKTVNNQLDDSSGNMTINGTNTGLAINLSSSTNGAIRILQPNLVAGTGGSDVTQMYLGAASSNFNSGGLTYNYAALSSNANSITLGLFNGGQLSVNGAGKVSTSGGSTLDDGSGNLTAGGGVLVNGAPASAPSGNTLLLTQVGGGGNIQAYNTGIAGGTLTLNNVGGPVHIGAGGLATLSSGGAVRSTLDDGSGNMTIAGTLTAANNNIHTTGLNVALALTTGNASASFFQANLTTAQTTSIQVGVSSSGNNTTSLGFANVGGAGSASNLATLGLLGSPAINVNGNGLLTAPAGITSTAAANTFGASTIGAITNSSSNTLGATTFSGGINTGTNAINGGNASIGVLTITAAGSNVIQVAGNGTTLGGALLLNSQSNGSAITMSNIGGSFNLAALIVAANGITSTATANTFGASTIGTITNTVTGNTFGSVQVPSNQLIITNAGGTNVARFTNPVAAAITVQLPPAGGTLIAQGDAATLGAITAALGSFVLNTGAAGQSAIGDQLWIANNSGIHFQNTSGTAGLFTTLVANTPATSSFSVILPDNGGSNATVQYQGNAVNAGANSITGGSVIIGSTTVTTGGSVSVALPASAGTLALTSQIPSLTGLPTLSAANVFTAANTFSSGIFNGSATGPGSGNAVTLGTSSSIPAIIASQAGVTAQLNIFSTNMQVIGNAAQPNITMQNGATNFTTTLIPTSTANRSISFPDATGTLQLSGAAVAAGSNAISGGAISGTTGTFTGAVTTVGLSNTGTLTNTGDLLLGSSNVTTLHKTSSAAATINLPAVGCTLAVGDFCYVTTTGGPATPSLSSISTVGSSVSLGSGKINVTGGLFEVSWVLAGAVAAAGAGTATLTFDTTGGNTFSGSNATTVPNATGSSQTLTSVIAVLYLTNPGAGAGSVTPSTSGFTSLSSGLFSVRRIA